ncbi:MAG: hypothetical protein E6Q06_02880 [Candidatus Moraniibacteriota bacterium]|nr:MAG: hypothetical protein E6Q06_02880 [Candidatus Moranbacteria bacterium]
MTERSQPILRQDVLLRARFWVLCFGLTIQASLLGVIAFLIHPSASTFILRYNAFFGVDLLGTWWQMYLVPAVCLVFFLGNIGIAEVMIRRQSYLPALVLILGASLVVLSEAIAMAALTFINS